MKPGWQTSEFWLSILGPALAIAVMLGYLRPADADSLQTVGAKVASDLIAFWGVVRVIVAYNASRAIVKSAPVMQLESDSTPPTGPRLAA